MRRSILLLLAVGGLAGAFAWQLGRTRNANAGESPSGAVVVRLAHFMLEPRARAAFDRALADFAALRRGEGRPVLLRTIEVPERALGPWLRTQVVGGTAPEIVMLRNANSPALSDRLVARHLVPLGLELDNPNPRNSGSALEGVPWRLTFYDGLELSGINFRLNEHYAVPLSAMSNRLLVNRALLSEILAHPVAVEARRFLPSDGLPVTYEQFIALGAVVLDYSSATGRRVYPIAGSLGNSLGVLEELFSSQTQRFSADFSWSPTFRAYEGSGAMLEALRRGERHLRDYPEFISGYRVLRDVGRFFQPGFLQQGREDAQFLFAQQRALMVNVTSTEAGAFAVATEGGFPIAVIPLPAPGTGHPEYGQHVLGPRSEAGFSSDTLLAMVSGSASTARAAALDLLHHLTSVPGNARFTGTAELVPAVVTVPVSPATEPFTPRVEGYPVAYGPMVETAGRGEFLRLAHLLFDTRRPLKDFVDEYHEALVRLLPAHLRSRDRQDMANLRQLDLLLTAARRLEASGEREPERTGVLLDVIERQSLSRGLRRQLHGVP